MTEIEKPKTENSEELGLVQGAEGAKEKPKKKKSFLKAFLDFMVYVVIVGVIVFGLPRFLVWKLGTNYPMAAITSGSMWPVLKTGDLVFIQGVKDRSEISEGNIIVFQNRVNNTLTIHRVIKLGETKITTKGDANFTEDAPVDYADVIGKALTWGKGVPVRIPYLGSVTVFANEFLKKGKTNNAAGTN